MYENYLLDSPSIAAVVNQIEGFRPQDVDENDVQALIDTKRQDRRYYCDAPQQIPADWIVHIDGAHLLSDIFSELSENRVSYEKTRHSVAITEPPESHRV